MIVLFHRVFIITKYIFTVISDTVTCRKECNSVAHEKHQNISVINNNYVEISEAEFEEGRGLRFFPPVYCQRYAAIKRALQDERWDGKIRKVVDFGCGEFGLFPYMKHINGLEELLTIDVDGDLLNRFAYRVAPLYVDYVDPRRQVPLIVRVLQGSLADTDPRLLGTDAVICIEVIEHLYPDTLEAVPYTVFGFIEPLIAIFTTPNSDFNVLFPNLTGFRHDDHKFEWTRDQFKEWAENITTRYPNYGVRIFGIGSGPPGTEKYGCCSQMAVFVKKDFQSHLQGLFKEATQRKAVNCPEVYEELRNYEFPFFVDNRTDDEKICTEAEYCIRRLSMNDIYHTDAGIHIPIKHLMHRVEQWCTSEEVVRDLLDAAGWETFVEPEDGMIYVVYPYFVDDVSSYPDPEESYFEEQDGFGEIEDMEEENWDAPREEQYNDSSNATTWGSDEHCIGTREDETLGAVGFTCDDSTKEASSVQEHIICDESTKEASSVQEHIICDEPTKEASSVQENNITSHIDMSNSYREVSKTEIGGSCVENNRPVDILTDRTQVSVELDVQNPGNNRVNSKTPCAIDKRIMTDLESNVILEQTVKSAVTYNTCRELDRCVEVSLERSKNSLHNEPAKLLTKERCSNNEALRKCESDKSENICAVSSSSFCSDSNKKNIKCSEDPVHESVQWLTDQIVSNQKSLTPNSNLLSDSAQMCCDSDSETDKPDISSQQPVTLNANISSVCGKICCDSGCKTDRLCSHASGLEMKEMSLHFSPETSVSSVTHPKFNHPLNIGCTTPSTQESSQDRSLVESCSLDEQNDKAVDSGYPNSCSVQDMEMDLTPEQVDEILSESEDVESEISISYSPESDSESGNESDLDRNRAIDNDGFVYHFRHEVLYDPVGHIVENGDVANNNRDGEGNNAVAVVPPHPEPEIPNGIDHDFIPLLAAAEDFDNDNDVIIPGEAQPFPHWLLNLIGLANPINGGGDLENFIQPAGEAIILIPDEGLGEDADVDADDDIDVNVHGSNSSNIGSDFDGSDVDLEAEEPAVEVVVPGDLGGGGEPDIFQGHQQQA